MAWLRNPVTMLILAIAIALPAADAAGEELKAYAPHTTERAMRSLAEAFRDRSEHQLTIVESEAAAIDHAGPRTIIVTTRPLSPSQREAGWVATPIARDAVVVIVHPSNTATDLTRAEVARIFAGRTARWASDQPIAVFAPAQPAAARQAFVEAVMGKTPISERATDKPLRATIFTIRKAVNAVTFASFGSLTTHDRVKHLAIDGIEPGYRTLHDGTYPITQTVSIVTQGEPTGAIGAFVAFATSDEGQRLIALAGLAPVADVESWLYLVEPLAEPVSAESSVDATQPVSEAPNLAGPADDLSADAATPEAVEGDIAVDDTMASNAPSDAPSVEAHTATEGDALIHAEVAPAR